MEMALAAGNSNQIPLDIRVILGNGVNTNNLLENSFEASDFDVRKAHLLQEVDDYAQEKLRYALESADVLSCDSGLAMIELEQMRRRFGYEHANLLERILINQVLFSWLRLKLFEIREISKESGTLDFSFGVQLRQAQAQFTKAYDALIKVKKLLPEFECL